MIKFEYISVAKPNNVPDNIDIIKSYGDVGWRLVCIADGYLYFERKYKLDYN